jgi:hypothetical protein
MHFLQVLDMKIWMNNIKSISIHQAIGCHDFILISIFFQFCEIGGLALFIGCTMLATIKNFNFGLCAGT